ncbi:MAG: hypothetical protein ACOX7F_00575 [Eubacteriales bacterium]|jgi:hypothetical protein
MKKFDPLKKWRERDILSDEMPDYSDPDPNQAANPKKFSHIMYYFFGLVFFAAGFMTNTGDENNQTTMFLIGFAFFVFGFITKKAADVEGGVMALLFGSPRNWIKKKKK